MKTLPLVILVLAVAGGLACLDYWANFLGQEPVLHAAPVSAPLADQPGDLVNSLGQTEGSVQPTQQVNPPGATSELTGVFPLLLAASTVEFPYTITAQQRVFDLFGIFNVNPLPGLQIIRYDMVPANSGEALSPIQVYELHQANQSAGITFLSLNTYLSAQVDPVNELNPVQAEYAANTLFYNPITPSENAFLLAENGIVLAFVYPKTSSATFQAIQSLLKSAPTHLASLVASSMSQ